MAEIHTGGPDEWLRCASDDGREIRGAVSTVLCKQDLGGDDGDGRSIVDRAICRSKDSMGTRESRQAQARLVGSDKLNK
jgi:hypothetical protein